MVADTRKKCKFLQDLSEKVFRYQFARNDIYMISLSYEEKRNHARRVQRKFDCAVQNEILNKIDRLSYDEVKKRAMSIICAIMNDKR